MLKDKIKALCKEKGVSVRQFEKDCDIGHGTITKWEKHTPTIATLMKIADYFNIPICRLVEMYLEGHGDG